MVEKGNEKNSPLDDVSEPYEVIAYRNRVRWVWSRTSDQIKFADGVQKYIVDKSDELNEEFETHIQFFGNEAWKKLAKVAVAVAGCTASMDETGEYLIVHKEHVKWAIDFMVNCYDNDLFRLKQYVVEQRRYAKTDNDCTYRVQELYAKHTTLLSQMEMISTMSQRNLQAISGMDNKEFSVVMNEMAGLMLFQWAGDKIIPSERFRASMRAINRDTHVKRIGEV
ncbi:MAG TPA: hypothetical protein VK190_11285, partial [Pseudoneobacillus sp.]|nr:hypothetical protein [Pseudoneobacillus sp.]